MSDIIMANSDVENWADCEFRTGDVLICCPDFCKTYKNVDSYSIGLGQTVTVNFREPNDRISKKPVFVVLGLKWVVSPGTGGNLEKAYKLLHIATREVILTNQVWFENKFIKVEV